MGLSLRTPVALSRGALFMTGRPRPGSHWAGAIDPFGSSHALETTIPVTRWFSHLTRTVFEEAVAARFHVDSRQGNMR